MSEVKAIESLPQEKRRERVEQLVNEVFVRFGTSAKDAAATIINGVKAGKTRCVHWRC